MKKTIIAILVCISTIGMQNSSQAQSIQQPNIGLGEIIFAETNPETTTHGIIMNELSYDIIKIHLNIAEKNTETISYESEALTTIQKLEELTKTDIIELLNISSNKEEALASYLNDCEKNLQKWDSISAYMKQEMAILKADMQSCLTEKNISDKAYFDAIERYDQKIMEASLTESIKNETCATENRIQYNAKIRIAEKLVFYLGLLQNKYDILFAKQNIVAQNFEIFRNNILPDLNKIDQLLQQYKF